MIKAPPRSRSNEHLDPGRLTRLRPRSEGDAIARKMRAIVARHPNTPVEPEGAK